MNLKRYLHHVAMSMIIVFGGTFLIRLLTSGEVLIPQLLLAAGGLLLLGISILVRSKDPSPADGEQTLSAMDEFKRSGPDKTGGRRSKKTGRSAPSDESSGSDRSKR